MRNVTMISASIDRFAAIQQGAFVKRRVAGYARVSTDKDDQCQSYEAQVDYYTNYIKSRADWQFVNVYTDEGITGTSIKKRDGFKNMIADALSGKIDLIITKSVSRFARNTVDSLTTIRKLKEKNVECYFEKENIWTFDGKGELLITIMSSLAQEEARSISENCTWGQRKRMADGRASVAYSHFLGYDEGFRINTDEANIVRRIYKMFLDGYGTSKIAEILTTEGITTPAGKAKWYTTTIKSILQNEKYKGEALMQKTFTEDFLTKRIRKNNGELKQYYVKESHDAIISPEVFDLVQSEMKSRHRKHGRKDDSVFNGKVICAKCGRAFSRYLWHSTDKYRKYVWHCSKSHTKCKSGNFSEDELKEIARCEINRILQPDYKKAMMILDESVFSTKSLGNKQERLQTEMSLLADKISDIIKRNASTGENLERQYNELASKYREMEEELNEVSEKIESLKTSRTRAESFIKELEKISEPLIEFDNEVFCHLVDRIETGGKGDVRVVWKGLCKD